MGAASVVLTWDVRDAIGLGVARSVSLQRCTQQPRWAPERGGAS